MISRDNASLIAIAATLALPSVSLLAAGQAARVATTIPRETCHASAFRSGMGAPTTPELEAVTLAS
jgi:hypothetical protein